MDYLVHIENRPFMRWQLDLLHESMRLCGLHEHLVIAYSQSSVPLPPPNFSRTLEVPHVGVAWGNRAMTKPYALWAAVKSGHIKQPFVLIDADVILKRPLPLLDEPLSCQWWTYMQREVLERDRGFGRFPTEKWWPVGSVYQFRDVPESVFEDILVCVKLMADTFRSGDGRLKDAVDYWCCEMVGMALGLAKSGLSVNVVSNFESHLDHRKPNFQDDVSLVHYYNHYEPWFYKRAYDENILPDCGLPYNLILSLPDTNSNLRALKTVTRSLVERTMMYKTTQAFKLVLDEGEIRCAGETAFVVKDGSTRRSADLNPGDELYNGRRILSVEVDGTTAIWRFPEPHADKIDNMKHHINCNLETGEETFFMDDVQVSKEEFERERYYIGDKEVSEEYFKRYPPWYMVPFFVAGALIYLGLSLCCYLYDGRLYDRRK